MWPKLVLLVALTIPLLTASGQSRERYRVMFYNVENLFDPFNDSLTNDDEFTPQGARRWTWNRMNTKLNNVYKVITAVGGWEAPVLVGLCEVENAFVVKRLITDTPLSKISYSMVHRNSPDSRGIDVALLYRPDLFNLIEARFFRVNLPEGTRTTREILYATGVLDGLDTLHVFVNHWPSKLGGELATEPARMAAAKTLRHKVDSIRIFYPQAHIIIMGDLNDGPNGYPVKEVLGAIAPTLPLSPSPLYNLHHRFEGSGTGTIKFRGAWEVIDMIIVSSTLLNRKHRVYANPDGGMIFQADFLTEEDVSFVGLRPFRTYLGFRYHGGFSDHFPIYMDLYPTR